MRLAWAGDRCEFMINLRSPAVTAPKHQVAVRLKGDRRAKRQPRNIRGDRQWCSSGSQCRKFGQQFIRLGEGMKCDRMDIPSHELTNSQRVMSMKVTSAQ